MLSVLLLGSSLAHATDIATDKTFGVGVATGNLWASATGKFWLNDKMGLAGYLGTAFTYHDLRVNFEMDIWDIKDWSFANLDLYWNAGIDVGLWTYYGLYFNPGIGGGVGVSLKFNKFPLEAFTDHGIGVYPLSAAYCAGFCYVGWRGVLGARYYF